MTNETMPKTKSDKVPPTKEERDRSLIGPREGVYLNPYVMGVSSVCAVSGFTDHALDALVLLKERVEKVRRGDFSVIDEILTAQMFTLNTMFNVYVERGAKASCVPTMESYIRLALKAQSQCRVTAETLVNVKNPTSATIVKQTNIGYNQQVNNNISPESASRLEEIKNQQTQLLEEDHGERLDQGETIKAGTDDKDLAAVEDVDRTTEPGRQEKSC